MRKRSWNERARVHTRLKMGISCWSSILAVTLLLRVSLHWSAILSFVQVDISRFRSFGAAYEGSVLRVYVKTLYSNVHTYLLGFVFRTNPRRIPASIDSSARNLAENHSEIMRRICARPRGYSRPPAPESRGIRRKNVSYLCQVPYVIENIHE